jgi:hypothetical protein
VPEEPTSQDIKAQRRWEKEMQLRRKQKEEQATEAQIIIYETELHFEQKTKDDKKRKEVTKPNHTAEWSREWLALITQLDGTGGHERLSKRAQQARHRILRKGGARAKSRQRLAATATANPRGRTRNEV